MEFADLNDDCIFVILENLDVADLLSVAQINVELSALAANVYRRIYSDTLVRIVDSNPLPTELSELFNETETIDADSFERIERVYTRFSNQPTYIEQGCGNVTIRSFETMWNLFKHFGHEIKKLTATPSEKTSSKNKAFLAYLFSKYSSESLVDVEIDRAPGRLLKYLTTPLTNVKNLAIVNYVDETGYWTFQKVETLFPQVNKFSASGISFPKGRSIRMESVTTFIGYYVSLENHHFPNLQTLHYTFYDFRSLEGFLSFFNEHRHMSHLHLRCHEKRGQMPSESQFELLTANLTDLVEVTLQHSNRISALALATFLRSHEKIELFRLTKSDIELEQILVGDGWNSTINDEGHTFERM